VNYKEGEYMERYAEGEQPPSPERREGLYINSIVIPADDEQPLRQSELPREGLADRQQLVGGYIQGVDVGDPPGRLYFNEEGKYMDLPPNKRATLLLWVHNPAFRHQDVIVGDAFLVGPAKRSADSGVPDEYVQALFNATSFRVELRSPGATEWQAHPERFDDWATAYEHAVGWSEAPRDTLTVRVVPEN
jgi:hypothetical protein